MSSASRLLGHFCWERKGQVAAAGARELKVGLKTQAEVCTSGVFTLANELVENHLRKPAEEIMIYPFCVCVCVCFFFPLQ